MRVAAVSVEHDASKRGNWTPSTLRGHQRRGAEMGQNCRAAAPVVSASARTQAMAADVGSENAARAAQSTRETVVFGDSSQSFFREITIGATLIRVAP